ncbi:MAG: type III pantothenate kinase, partial [Brevinematales bacterium]|nr:type III pantothenate kinase [Brevinematales bacterium]
MKKILCIDIGNTNVVLGISSCNKEDFNFKHFRITTNHFTTIDEVSLSLHTVLNYFEVDKTDISSIVISSVVPEVDIQYRYCLL